MVTDKPIFTHRVVICNKVNIEHERLSYLMQNMFIENYIDCYTPIYRGLDIFSKNELIEIHYKKIEKGDIIIGSFLS